MKMNLTCEAEVRIQNEYAVRCAINSKPVCVLEYVKAISSLVGASHILAVFEEIDAIKVFFDDKRHVDTLIRNCLHVLGRHVQVDYVIPPGTKLILSNVDPIIANFDVMRLLTVYGTIVSPVICPPISDDTELCHIGYGVRHVYMEINGHIPERLEFKYGDQLCNIKIKVAEGTDSIIIPYIKTDDSEMNLVEAETESVSSHDSLAGPSGIHSIPIQDTGAPILVSVQSVSGPTSNEQIESPSSQTKNVAASSSESVEMKRRGRPSHIGKHKKMTSTSRAAKRIQKNKHKWLQSHYRRGRGRGRGRGKFTQRVLRNSVTLPVNNYNEDSNSSSTCSTLPVLVKFSDDSNSNMFNTTNEVIDKKELLMYLDEVKNHRAPLELAKKYLGEDCDSNKIHRFIHQLVQYKTLQDDMNLKNRIWRLVKTLNDTLSSST